MYLILLDFSQRTLELCQTSDAENFEKVFAALTPLNILAKISVSLCLMGNLDSPSVDFNY